MAKAVLAYEPLIPRFASFFLNRKLRLWKKKGRIATYKASFKRLSALHYIFQVEVELTHGQTRELFSAVINKGVKLKGGG
jgi:hypothetical protein